MTKQKFKYNLNHYISIQPEHISVAHIENILSSEFSISRTTFYRDRNTLLTDSFFISTERLMIYSALFSVTIDKLKNYSVKKIKPLNKRRFSNTSTRNGK